MTTKTINEIIADHDRRDAVEARFNSKIARSDDTSCWPWTAKSKHKFGYGVLNGGSNKTVNAHCLAWALKNGPIPDGGFVLHTCDNPSCCNPHHLYIGDNAQNMRDMKERGRGRLGQKHTAETKRKISEARALNPPKQTESARASRSEALRKRWRDPDWRARFYEATSGPNNSAFGKPPSAERLASVVRANKARTGYRHSEDTKAKMRASRLARERGSQGHELRNLPD